MYLYSDSLIIQWYSERKKRHFVLCTNGTFTQVNALW